jgi:DNA invertase Pin-like site-specific DNA recombinase
MGRAIAYVSDIVPGRAGEVLTRSRQIEIIKQFAADSEIEIAAWFEDETCNAAVLNRPGIRALLECRQPYDRVICARVWALARSRAALEPFFQELDRRGVGFAAAASTWDCVSQQSRRRFKSLPVLPQVDRIPDAMGEFRYRVAKPVRLNFVHLVHRAAPSMPQRL